MSLSPGERHRLGEIELQLRRSDPQLAAMFTHWTANRIRRWSWHLALRARGLSLGDLVWLSVIVTGLALAIGLAIAGVLWTSHTGSAVCGQRHASEVASAGAYPGGPCP